MNRSGEWCSANLRGTDQISRPEGMIFSSVEITLSGDQSASFAS
jgi:hypothetical protein